MERDIMGDEDMPSSVMWSEEEIQTYHFQYRSILQKLLTHLHGVMLKFLSRHPYNSVTSIVRFYEAYKKQKMPLMDFYELEHKPSITKDSQNCLGRALYLRKKLLKYLSSEYTDLDKHLYLVTGNKLTFTEIPDRYKTCPPLHTIFAKDHAALVIKFTLENDKRPGYVVLDPGYLIDFPVVAMEDALPPHTGKFEFIRRQGEKVFEFTYFNENYVHLSTKNAPSQENEKQGDQQLHRWFYVGKKLKNVRQIEKRNMFREFRAMAFTELAGPCENFYTMLHEKDHILLSIPISQLNEEQRQKLEMGRNFIQYKIPFSYLLTNKDSDKQRNIDWDLALQIMSKKYRYRDGFHDLMRRFAILATDSEFVSQVASINKEWSGNVEESFLS